MNSLWDFGRSFVATHFAKRPREADDIGDDGSSHHQVLEHDRPSLQHSVSQYRSPRSSQHDGRPQERHSSSHRHREREYDDAGSLYASARDIDHVWRDNGRRSNSATRRFHSSATEPHAPRMPSHDRHHRVERSERGEGGRPSRKRRRIEELVFQEPEPKKEQSRSSHLKMPSRTRSRIEPRFAEVKADGVQRASTGSNGGYAPVGPAPPSAPVLRSSVETARALMSVAAKSAHLSNQEQEMVRPEYDDENGHYKYAEGELLDQRYFVKRKLGEGTFGKVLECHDYKKNKDVAVKVIKNIPKYRQAATIEIGVLLELKKHDPTGENRCIELISYFEFRNHVCMVFDLLGISLFDFLKANDFCPFPLEHIRHFAFQMVKAVEYMHRLLLVHTDLKPENILLMDETSKSYYDRRKRKPCRRLLDTSIKIIDFGSATFHDQHHTTIVCTRHYRAPEIVLGGCLHSQL
eukprot:Opistho-2@29602